MAQTGADVEFCPYCGGDVADGYWETNLDPDWVHVCGECDEHFTTTNKLPQDFSVPRA